MAAFFNPESITFNGDEVKDINEIIFSKQLKYPALDVFHAIDEGIKAKKQILLMSRLNGLIGKDSGGCEPTPNTNTVTPSEKFWDLATYSDRLGFCYKEMLPSFLNYSKKVGVDSPDVTDFVNFMVDKVISDALSESIVMWAWFSDTDAAAVDDSPAGLLTAGTNPVYFNRMDGLWKQAYAIVAANANRKTTGLATKNSQATFALQKFNSTDTTNKVVTTTLQTMYTDADMTLRQQEGLQFEVTQTVFDQYVRELKAYNVAYTTERLENGLFAVKSDGIDVIAMPLWDKIITNYYSDGTRYDLPHRAVLAVKDNVRIGTESVGTFNTFDVWYDKKDRKVYVDFELGLDAKIIVNNEIQVAY